VPRTVMCPSPPRAQMEQSTTPLPRHITAPSRPA
jgi:hypothetical protein